MTTEETLLRMKKQIEKGEYKNYEFLYN